MKKSLCLVLFLTNLILAFSDYEKQGFSSTFFQASKSLRAERKRQVAIDIDLHLTTLAALTSANQFPPTPSTILIYLYPHENILELVTRDLTGKNECLRSSGITN